MTRRGGGGGIVFLYAEVAQKGISSFSQMACSQNGSAKERNHKT